MDTAGVETVDFNALGGTDAIAGIDLAATDVTPDQHRPRRPRSAAAPATAQIDSVVVNAHQRQRRRSRLPADRYRRSP